MKQIEPEQYNQYGEIVIVEPVSKPYERTMSSSDQHRIHETKDLFDSSCSLCTLSAKAFTCSKCGEYCYSKPGVKDHWMLEH